MLKIISLEVPAESVRPGAGAVAEGRVPNFRRCFKKPSVECILPQKPAIT